MEDTQVKNLVNKIFAMKNMPKVTNFAQEFSDGGKHTLPWGRLIWLSKRGYYRGAAFFCVFRDPQ